jgi:acyl carrier protein
VDLKLLPYPNTDNSLGDEVFIPPGNPLEDRLASIVARLLGMERVSVEDNFFLLGGRSLLGTQLIASISDNFGVEVPLRTLFELPTIRAQAAEIERLLTAKVQAMSEDDAQRALASLSDRDRRAMPLSTKAA